MPDPDDQRELIAGARRALSEASRARLEKLVDLRLVSKERSAVRRKKDAAGADVTQVEERYSTAFAALEQARLSESKAKASLRTLLKRLQNPAEAIAGLRPEVPIVLFPVRLETRFIRFEQPVDRDDLPDLVGELRVRIYPDGILTDSHEPLLSESELALGRRYWRKAWQDAGEQDAWSLLVAELSTPRAAWVVRRCRPTNIQAFPTEPGAATAPVFADLDTRPANWQRTPEARLLPDRWVVAAVPDRAVTAGERERYHVTSAAVAEPLALTLSLGTDAQGVAGDRITLADGLQVDDEILWTFDFNRAEEMGMAVRIPLIEEDFTHGFAQVLVVGMNTSLTPDEARLQLEALFDSHHYSRGLAFIQQGTPTNNTAGRAAGYPPADPRGIESFRVERGAPLTAAGGDGVAFMRALGLPASAADHLAGADLQEQRSARAMAAALWPTTLGYYLRQMMVSELDVPDQPADLSEETIEKLRHHFIELIRGRGPFPAFRVGDVPYGLLPVSDLTNARPDPADSPADAAGEFENRMRMILAELRANMRNLSRRYAPHIGRSADADADLMDTFRMDASSREVYIRPVVGEAVIDNITRMAGGDVDRIREPIEMDIPIDPGGPIDEPGGPVVDPAGGLTLRTLLGFGDDFPDTINPESGEDGVVPRPPGEGGPIG